MAIFAMWMIGDWGTTLRSSLRIRLEILSMCYEVHNSQRHSLTMLEFATQLLSSKFSGW